MLLEDALGKKGKRTAVKAGDMLHFHKDGEGTLIAISRPYVGRLLWPQTNNDKLDVSRFLSSIDDAADVVFFTELVSSMFGLAVEYALNEVQPDQSGGWLIQLKSRA